MIDVAIVSPLYDGRAHDDHAESVDRARLALAKAGLKSVRRTVRGCPVLPRARNHCVALALLAGAREVLFVDGDIGFEPEAVFQLLAHDAPIVGAAPQAQLQSWRDAAQPRCVWVPHAAPPPGRAPAGLVPARQLATGFMKVRAEVFPALVHAGLARRYIVKDTDPRCWPYLASYFYYGLIAADLDADPALKAQVTAARAAGIDVPDSALMIDQGEDYYFCDRALEAGFPAYLDPAVKVRHWEGRCVHDFSLAEALELERGRQEHANE